MKSKKIIKITGISLGLILLIISVTISVLFILGYRFTSQSASGPSLKTSTVIKTKEYDFYCITVDLIDKENKIGEAITMICPIKKVGFLYKEINDYKYNKVILKENDSYAGTLVSFKCKDGYHNFFLRYMLQQEIMYNYKTITVDGTKLDIFKYSYFVTKNKITHFELGEKELLVMY